MGEDEGGGESINKKGYYVPLSLPPHPFPLPSAFGGQAEGRGK